MFGNDIGTNRKGAFQAGFGNVEDGIDIASSTNNTIGGAADSPGTAPGNVIVGNGVGIAIVGLSTGECR